MVELGDGAMGIVRIHQKGEIEHVVQVVNRGGQVTFIDTQAGQVVTLRPDLRVQLGVTYPTGPF
jgi:hypothetical protein